MGFNKKTVRDIEVNGRTVLVRVDYNVPQDAEGMVSDDLRIRESLATILHLLDAGAKVALVAHLGRPDGEWKSEFSLKPVYDRLRTLLPDEQVRFVESNVMTDAFGVRQEFYQTGPRSVVLLENIRFYPEEELKGRVKDDDGVVDEERTAENRSRKLSFANKLVEATGAEFFVLDGFGVAHRDNTSVSTMSEVLPGVAGFLLEKEVETISRAMENPVRPFVAIIGGAKISDKIGVVKAFVEKADSVIIGGAMANTFLRYKGFSVGNSMVENGQEMVLDDIYRVADEHHKMLVLPSDVMVGSEVSENAVPVEKDVHDVADGDVILDAGPNARSEAIDHISRAGTVIWNGTLGMTELSGFAHGSIQVLEAISGNEGATSIIGGGDTAGFVENYQKTHPEIHVSHISTGGGASLELMEGKVLPGVAALQDK